MDSGTFAAFVAVDLLLVMTPGADWAYAIAAGLRGGTVLPSVAGLAGGYVLHAALVTAGVGALLAGSGTALSALTLVGAAYLVWLGTTVARHPASISADRRAALSPIRAVVRGAAVSGLNPKGLLLFFAMLPQFVAAHAPWPVPAQLAVLGAFHVVACAVVYLSVALTARRLLRSRPAAALIVGRVSGTCMIVVGVALTIEQMMLASA